MNYIYYNFVNILKKDIKIKREKNMNLKNIKIRLEKEKYKENNLK